MTSRRAPIEYAEGQLAELMAVIGLASETNRLAIGYDVPVAARFSEN